MGRWGVPAAHCFQIAPPIKGCDRWGVDPTGGAPTLSHEAMFFSSAFCIQTFGENKR